MSEDTLKLDARRRAMLDEMGVKVWWPAATRAGAMAVGATPVEIDAAPTAGSVAPVLARSAVVAPAAAAPAPVAPSARPHAGPAHAHGAAVLAEAPGRIGGGDARATGGWLIVADMPPEPDGRHGEPFQGDAGRLLDNMLRALGLQGGDLPVHLMRTHRGVASGRAESPRPIEEVIVESAAQLAPRVVLAMGPLAAQYLLQSSDPLGRLRGRAVARALGAGVPELPVIATYHPAYLLRNPADKARAWADLCLAADQLPQSK